MKVIKINAILLKCNVLKKWCFYYEYNFYCVNKLQKAYNWFVCCYYEKLYENKIEGKDSRYRDNIAKRTKPLWRKQETGYKHKEKRSDQSSSLTFHLESKVLSIENFQQKTTKTTHFTHHYTFLRVERLASVSCVWRHK